MSMKNLGKVFPKLLTYHKKTKRVKKKLMVEIGTGKIHITMFQIYFLLPLKLVQKQYKKKRRKKCCNNFQRNKKCHSDNEIR